MNLLDYEVIEVVKVEKYDNTMKDLEWLKEDVNVYTVKAKDWDYNATIREYEIWVKVSEDKGQIKEGYVFYR